MRTTNVIEIAATPARVWAVWSDVLRWSEWTKSVTRIEALNGAPALAVGAQYRIVQPRLPTLVWEVTAVAPGQSWTWSTRSPGATTTAWHQIHGDLDGPARAEMGLDQTGLLGELFGRLYLGLTRRYLGLESEGLKRRAEQPPPG